MGDTESKVPTPGGQLLDYCLKSIGEQQQLDANTMLALLSLVNLTNILELIGQGRMGGQQILKSEDSPLTGALKEVIPPGSDKMGMLNNLMGMLGGGGGDLSKLMPLVSMLGAAMKNNQQPAEVAAPPKQQEEPQGEVAATETEAKEPPATSGWARVGR